MAEERRVRMGDRSNAGWFDVDSFWLDQYPLMFSDQGFVEASAQVEQLVGLLPPSAREVLDLGCGPSRFAVPMAQRGYHSGQELSDCLKSVGLEEASLFGDLVGGEFGFHAERLVALGQK